MSKVSTAVAKAAQAPAQVSPAAYVRQVIDRQGASFRQALPRHVDPDRFARLVLTAIRATPQLMACFETPQGETSVLLAAMQAAAVGLEPNTPTQDAWLLPRRNRGVWECQLSIGYRGILKLARRSLLTKSVVADVVRENDHFVYERGLESDRFEHRRAEGDRGRLTHAYAIVRYTTGGYHFVVLDRSDVEARREMSDSWRNEKSRPHSPWTKHEPAMWRKSAIRALVPFLDLSAEAARVIELDERPLAWDDDAGVIEAIGELTPGDGQTVDETTGEITEPPLIDEAQS